MVIVSLNRCVCRKNTQLQVIAHRYWSNFRRIFMSNFVDLPWRRKFYRIQRIWFEESPREDLLLSPVVQIYGLPWKAELSLCPFVSLSLHCHLWVTFLLAPLFINHSHRPRVLRCEDIYAETSDFSFPVHLVVYRAVTRNRSRREKSQIPRNSKGTRKRGRNSRVVTSTKRMRVIVAVQQRACSLGAVFVLGG